MTRSSGQAAQRVLVVAANTEVQDRDCSSTPDRRSISAPARTGCDD